MELVNCAAIQASASERQIHRQVTRSARLRSRALRGARRGDRNALRSPMLGRSLVSSLTLAVSAGPVSSSSHALLHLRVGPPLADLWAISGCRFYFSVMEQLDIEHE